MKIIPKITLLDQLEGRLSNYSPTISFSIFSPKNNYHSIDETFELFKQNTSVSIIELIAFRPSRILSHEIIIALTTNIQIHNLHFDLQNKFKLINSLINIEEFVKNGDILRQENLALYDIIKADKLTNNQIKATAREVVAQAINESQLKHLTEYTLNQRHTFAVNGPIASGKSIFASILEPYIIDTAKIHGDSYKLLLNPEYLEITSPRDMEFFSQLVQEEIHYLNREICHRLLEKITTSNKAPNVYIDKSLLNQQGVDMSTIGGGTVQGILVSLPIKEALYRSEMRGNSTGRFEDTSEILMSHNSIATNFANLITNNKDKDISYLVFDNNVEIGSPPIKTAKVDFKNKKIEIFEKDKFIEFLNKADLDINKSLENSNITCSENQFQSSSLYFINQIHEAGYSMPIELLGMLPHYVFT
jgi:hypothetical protein